MEEARELLIEVIEIIRNLPIDIEMIENLLLDIRNLLLGVELELVHIILLLSPFLCAIVAYYKNRSVRLWFFIGLFFNVFALAIISTAKSPKHFYRAVTRNLKKAFKKRIEELEFSYKISYYQIDNEALAKVIEDFKNNYDDYYRETVRGWNYQYFGDTEEVTVHIKLNHGLTREQDKYTFKEVSKIIKKTVRPYMSEHHKLKAVHNYIVENVVYDHQREKWTAYDALKEGETVCAGYSQLTYLCLDELGIKNKIIVGKANENIQDQSSDENHAWNMVKIAGNWYHLDVTWNSCIYHRGGFRYKYYNLSDQEISSDHSWDLDKYPTAKREYLKYPLVKRESITLI